MAFGPLNAETRGEAPPREGQMRMAGDLSFLLRDYETAQGHDALFRVPKTKQLGTQAVRSCSRLISNTVCFQYVKHIILMLKQCLTNLLKRLVVSADIEANYHLLFPNVQYERQTVAQRKSKDTFGNPQTSRENQKSEVRDPQNSLGKTGNTQSIQFELNCAVKSTKCTFPQS